MSVFCKDLEGVGGLGALPENTPIVPGASCLWGDKGKTGVKGRKGLGSMTSDYCHPEGKKEHCSKGRKCTLMYINKECERNVREWKMYEGNVYLL